MENDITPYANNIFEQPWWLKAVAGEYWDEITVWENDSLIGRLPVCYSKSNKKIEMPFLTQTCGIWIKVDSELSFNEQSNEIKKIVDNILAQIPDNVSIKIALDSSFKYFLPFCWKGFSIRPRISYRIEDLTDLDAIYQKFSKNIKRDIKSAKKKLTLLENCSIDTLMDIMNKTFSDQGRSYPVPYQVIKNVVTESEKHHAGKMFCAADSEGNVHACAYFVYDQNVFYYLIGGKDSKYKNSNAQTLILWEAIKYASSVSKIFDFEGSMVEGIETFFKRFGGLPVVYYEIQRQSLYNDIKDAIKPRLKRLLGYKI